MKNFKNYWSVHAITSVSIIDSEALKKAVMITLRKLLQAVNKSISSIVLRHLLF